ncbi:MAG: hypothetical protein PHF25_05735 [Candidatus Margulisbacteria bacterium]|nr:hypothetical protein [Candidatus Margulisiibacteriota bacterium]
MKKLLIVSCICISSALFAFQPGFSVYGLYDFTNKVDVSMSGIDFAYNYKETPGVGLSYSELINDIGFSIDCAYYLDRTVDSGTAFGITAPFSGTLVKFSQLITQANLLTSISDNLIVFGGINYTYMSFTNTSAKLEGDFGYQAGAILGSDTLSFKLAYQLINGKLVSESGISSDKFTASGLVASVMLTI